MCVPFFFLRLFRQVLPNAAPATLAEILEVNMDELHRPLRDAEPDPPGSGSIRWGQSGRRETIVNVPSSVS